MKKGFTLIELLAVITLLGLLSLIVVPVVDKLIKNSQDDLYETQISNIEMAAKNWASENIFSLPDSGYIDKTICDLERSGFLDVDIKNPKTDELFYKDSYVRITKTNYGFEYKYIETGNSLVCNVCVAATEENKTGTGTIAIPGQYNYGDEYKCDVGKTDDTKGLTFFLLEDKGDYVSLIMNKNIGEFVYWCDDETRCKVNGQWSNTLGPITAEEYLESKTQKWLVDTSLPTYEQIYNINNGTNLRSDKWIYDYLQNSTNEIIGVYGYWTSKAYSPGDDYYDAYVVDCDGYLVPVGINSNVSTPSDHYGIRPVITIKKSELLN